MALTAESIDRFYKDAIEMGTRFEGQMAEDFQADLAHAYANVTVGECDFYHTMEFGSDEIVRGAWDLRGRERSYLGHVDLSRQRVLEFGPATGYLSYCMERQGADLVCFDLAPGLAQDIVPQLGHDLETQRNLSIAYAERVRNSWWYGHARLKSKAKAVYGDIYSLPEDLGRYDVSTFGCTLMHLSKPFFALQQAAAVTDKAIIVTEPIPRIPRDHETPSLEFVPVDTSRTVVVWWLLSPGSVIRMLKVLGFFEVSVHYHVQRHHPYHELDKPAVDHLFFTVVGQRYKDMVPMMARSESAIAAELDLRRAWRPDPTKIEQLEAEIQGLKSSISWRITRPVRMVGSVLRRLGLRS